MKVQPFHAYAIFADYKTDLGFTKSQESFWAGFWLNGTPDAGSPGYFKCPYGVPGDWLWVREAFAHDRYSEGNYYFKADDKQRPKTASDWHPSIHMSRFASRITLEITNIRVERLTDISVEDARAEGVTPVGVEGDGRRWRGGFRDLWDSIYSKKGMGWDRNPWVWVVEFNLNP